MAPECYLVDTESQPAKSVHFEPLSTEFTDRLVRAHQIAFDILQARSRTDGRMDDVTSSAFRTTLRRYRHGLAALADLDDEDLADFLLVRAYERLRAERSRRVLPLLFDPAAPNSSEDEDNFDWDGFHHYLKRELDALHARLNLYIKSPLQQAVFRQLFKNEYGGQKLTQEQIASLCSCTISTVYRVQVKFNLIWRPLVDEARERLRPVLLQQTP